MADERTLVLCKPDAVARAVDAAPDTEAVVVTGSLYTVGEARDLLMGPGPA